MDIPTFKNKRLFNQVFTHRSYLNEVSGRQLESNERLEFLGDSILSFVVSSYLFKRYKNLKEGELTNMRSALTNTQTLYGIAKSLELGKFLKLSKGEVAGGGRSSKSILANTFEALIGGVYFDQGLEQAKKFIENVLLSNMEDIVKSEELKDPKSRLQEKVQERYKTAPLYKVIAEEGPDHNKVYTVAAYLDDKLLATATGHSKQEAEKKAAKNALSSLKETESST